MVGKTDMTLDEFINLSESENIKGDTYRVSFKLFNGTMTNLFVDEAYSEYEAKERSFLYLNALIYGKKDQEFED